MGNEVYLADIGDLTWSTVSSHYAALTCSLPLTAAAAPCTNSSV